MSQGSLVPTSHAGKHRRHASKASDIAACARLASILSRRLPELMTARLPFLVVSRLAASRHRLLASYSTVVSIAQPTRGGGWFDVARSTASPHSRRPACGSSTGPLAAPLVLEHPALLSRKRWLDIILRLGASGSIRPAMGYP